MSSFHRKTFVDKPNENFKSFKTPRYPHISGGSKYKYVGKYTKEDVTKWTIRIPKICGIRAFDTERQAAITVDKLLIKAGRKPVNILKPSP